jgi:hypothetical protein
MIFASRQQTGQFSFRAGRRSRINMADAYQMTIQKTMTAKIAYRGTAPVFQKFTARWMYQIKATERMILNRYEKIFEAGGQSVSGISVWFLAGE